MYDVVKRYKQNFINFLWLKSLKSSIKEQRLDALYALLERIVPDISDQYSMFKINTPYLTTKVRGVHAFQISLVNNLLAEFEKVSIVDIGDSAGTHMQYINGLCAKDKAIHCVSVNLDQKAVEKIKEKGLNAVYARAEELHRYNVNADIFLCFETLEHLMNPSHFLHELSTKTKVKYLVITVPYVKNSRIGLHHIRNNRMATTTAETTHLFELNPMDWKLLVRHSGWDIVTENIYYQYPKKSIWRITQPLWKRFDFEGFYGLVLRRDDKWSSKYVDW